jgi:hypothetical protein
MAQWNGSQAYSDSKLFDTMLAFAIAHLACGSIERCRSGLGADQDGRPRRSG